MITTVFPWFYQYINNYYPLLRALLSLQFLEKFLGLLHLANQDFDADHGVNTLARSSADWTPHRSHLGAWRSLQKLEDIMVRYILWSYGMLPFASSKASQKNLSKPRNCGHGHMATWPWPLPSPGLWKWLPSRMPRQAGHCSLLCRSPRSWWKGYLQLPVTKARMDADKTCGSCLFSEWPTDDQIDITLYIVIC